MKATRLALLLASLTAIGMAQEARADPKTVCTITVNSSDEREAFRRSLPADKYRFVELVERGRPDWLASACRQRIRCDVLVISGHYDGRDEFYSDRPGATAFLPVEEMERASCTPSCSGLFSQLKEVYLFGCNTLNPDALKRLSGEVPRSLVREGRSPAEAARLTRSLASLHGGSSRDRMRLIFDHVPVIYGFSAKAPVGPVAGSMLGSYFRAGGAADVASGRLSSRLLEHFASSSMAVASGLAATEPLAALRDDVCRFSDDALAPEQKLAFIHSLLDRDMAEVRPFLDRIERYASALPGAGEATPAVSQELVEIAHDESARSRFLAFARDADQPSVRARMIALAQRLGWLSPEEERAQLTTLLRERLEGNVSPADVELACGLDDDHALDAELPALAAASPPVRSVGQAAMLACLNSADARRQVLPAVVSPRDDDFEIAQVLLRHRPLDDAGEARTITAAIADAGDARVQVRALSALAGQHLSDPRSLEELTRLYPVAQTPGVQVAIAGVLLRSDYDSIASPEVVQTLRESRLRSGSDPDVVDVLIRRLEAQ
ncbi:MAG TPA: hypothetical protein VMN79_05980 [Casimicrobiaceae bacterium]|nr:hypothetical protein [Casimicrobiaceae bacterium]